MLFTGNFSKDDLAKSKKRFYWVGGIMLVIGFLSLAMPMLASFAIETMVGFFLLAVGFGNAFGAYSWPLSPSPRASSSSSIRSRG